MHNPGHYFWQEVHGLMLLIEYNLLDNIDELIIYNYGYLNIADFFKKKFNKNIKYITSNTEIHNLTINISKHYINNSSLEIFKDMYDLTNIIKIKSNEINILFDIRSNYRIWLNQIPIIINIMNGVKNKYRNYNINFYISGFYTYKQTSLSSTIYNKTKEINTQNKIFNTIQSKVKFKIFNLINKNLSEIIYITQNIDLCIANLGSGIGFYYSCIFNKPTIGFTNPKNSLLFNNQRYAFENKLNKYTNILPCYITNKNGIFFLKPGVLFNSVISKINGLL